jgi:hypothetical protein
MPPCRAGVSFPQSSTEMLIPLAVVFIEGQYAIEWRAPLPSCALKIRLRSELVDVAKAEVGDGCDVAGNAQGRAQPFRFENAHPSDTDTFCTRGKPEVLYRADR